MTRSQRNIAVAVLLSVGLAAGVTLVLVGGTDRAGSDDPTTSAPAAALPPDSAAPASERRAPLPLDDLSQTAVAELTGLAVPATATEFLTARLDDDRQLDITFVMPSDEVAAFVTGSGLPEPVADQRVVLHSSPLWMLNPDAGVSVSGVTDSTGQVDRAVELVPTGADDVRARIVITSAR